MLGLGVGTVLSLFIPASLGVQHQFFGFFVIVCIRDAFSLPFGLERLQWVYGFVQLVGQSFFLTVIGKLTHYGLRSGGRLQGTQFASPESDKAVMLGFRVGAIGIFLFPASLGFQH